MPIPLWICPRCGRHHSEGLCPARSAPKYPPKKLPALSSSLSEWLVVYERNLHEFATETGGVPLPEHIKRAEWLADREIKRIYENKQV